MNQQQVTDMITTAFSKPIDASDYIRISFLVGGGKKIRKNYDDALPMFVTAALGRLGYREDRGASCNSECQLSYKYQHDLGKDVKVVHVYPQINLTQVGEQEEDDDNMDPVRACGLCSVGLFCRLVSKQCPSFAQKRALLHALKQRQTLVNDLETKLANLALLTPEEQTVYDETADLAEKIKWLQTQMEEAIDTQQLTQGEVVLAATALEQKAEKIREQIEKEENASKRAKFEGMLSGVTEKLRHVQGTNPIPSAYAKQHTALANANKALAKVLKQLDSKAGGPKTLEVAKQLANERDTLQAEIDDVQAQLAKVWFSSAVEEAAKLKSKVLQSTPAQPPIAAQATPKQQTQQTKQTKQTPQAAVVVNANSGKGGKDELFWET
eukprot:c20468_g2_i2.p1 GENE.c20468_g2_i2~~c20468_g2_i2.p1  ORF type:complete len:419 (+),score=111.59 c20468_g2_i2:114-1259(+)